VIADGLREHVDYRICEKMFAVKILLTFYDSPLADSQTQVIFLRDNNNNKAFIIKLSIASCYKVLFLIMCRFC